MVLYTLAFLIVLLAVLDARFTAQHPYRGEMNRLVRILGPWPGVLLPTAAMVGALLWLSLPTILGVLLGIRLQLAFAQALVCRIERQRSKGPNR